MQENLQEILNKLNSAETPVEVNTLLISALNTLVYFFSDRYTKQEGDQTLQVVTQFINEVNQMVSEKMDGFDVSEIQSAFATLLSDQGKKTGKTANRAERLWQMFRHRERAVISTNELAKAFTGIQDSKNAVRIAVSLVNEAFIRLNIPYEFFHFSGYGIRRRKNN